MTDDYEHPTLAFAARRVAVYYRDIPH